MCHKRKKGSTVTTHSHKGGYCCECCSSKISFLVWVSYIFVVFLTVASFAWYPSLNYVAPLMWYNYYPVAGMIGAFVTGEWSNLTGVKVWMNGITALLAFWGVIVNLILVSMYWYQFLQPTGIQALLNGNYYFPQLGNRRYYVTAVSRLVEGIAEQNMTGYTLLQFTVTVLNVCLCLATMIICIWRFWHIKVDEDEDTTKLLFKAQFVDARLGSTAISIISLILLALFLIYSLVFFFFGIFPFSLYTNQHCWFIMMAFISFYPPEGILLHHEDIVKKNEYRHGDTKGESFVRELSIFDEKQLTWILGTTMTLVVEIFSLYTTYDWRITTNRITPGVCAYDPYLLRLNGTLPLYYFKPPISLTPADQQVTYTNTTMYSNNEQWVPYACLNDMFDILVLVLSFTLWWLSIYVSVSGSSNKDAKAMAAQLKKEREGQEEDNTAFLVKSLTTPENSVMQQQQPITGFYDRFRTTSRKRSILN